MVQSSLEVSHSRCNNSSDSVPDTETDIYRLSLKKGMCRCDLINLAKKPAWFIFGIFFFSHAT